MKWLEDLEDMLVTFANQADGPESTEAINVGILAEAIRQAKRLRERAERAERERDKVLDSFIHVGTREDIRSFFGLDAAPAGAGDEPKEEGS